MPHQRRPRRADRSVRIDRLTVDEALLVQRELTKLREAGKIPAHVSVDILMYPPSFGEVIETR